MLSRGRKARRPSRHRLCGRVADRKRALCGALDRGCGGGGSRDGGGLPPPSGRRSRDRAGVLRGVSGPVANSESGRPVKVVVTGLIGNYPLGGVAWDYLQFVKGFVALGCQVTYLEDTGQWAYNPRLATFTADASDNVRYLRDVLARIPGMESSFAFRDPRGAVHGVSEAEIARRCREADLFLNVSGAAWFRDAYRGARVSAYYDSD